MKNIIRNYFVLLSIILLFCSSIFIVSASDDKLSKVDFINDKDEINDSSIKKQGENGEGGEGKITPFNKLENDFEDTEENHKNPLVILGNQVKRDGSNGFEKHPVYLILAITSLITIIMVCIFRKK
jgi:hypothetical protein